MPKPQYLSALLAVCAVLNSGGSLASEQPATSADIKALSLEAKGIVKQFAGTLKPQLKQAMQAGGPTHAISVCAEQAPKISAKLSTETGWQINRVSLKTRNPAAQPDDWEQRILQQFAQRQQAGAPVAPMKHAEAIDGQFRFMKAQGVEAVCLACHGQQLAPAVQQALQQHYPNDQATGYSLGQVRGAISLTKPLP